ncbi:hypothetical protein BDK92_6284 [Micromonospora pisi]|uniref:Uncharacterized protein n=1 Tax=Micromonospora pisi TaxID=589240 RepID=A0A495JTI1_9ACTN|nr:hypothetical protein BDK92_6284 [Micromonospora pisi]
MFGIPFLACLSDGIAVFGRPVRKGFDKMCEAVAHRREPVLDLLSGYGLECRAAYG